MSQVLSNVSRESKLTLFFILGAASTLLVMPTLHGQRVLEIRVAVGTGAKASSWCHPVLPDGRPWAKCWLPRQTTRRLGRVHLVPTPPPLTTTVMIRLPEAADTAREKGYEKKMMIGPDFYKNISISNMRTNCLLN